MAIIRFKDENGNVVDIPAITGASAYQIAVKNGFEGTEAEWLESLKGTQGEKGDTGADGTSVTISSVSESEADGGSNVVTFSDGKTLTVKNGNAGSDYVLTDDDKIEIAELVAAQINNGVVGIVNNDNNILLAGNLADGTYAIKYENEDGTYTEIGSLTVGDDPTSEE